MSAPVLLLSDLHLPRDGGELRSRFLAFLQGPARDASAVYLLGDIFESWIGDDLDLAPHAPEVAALAALSASGVNLYVMHGNRDFLLGEAFSQLTGATLLRDPSVVELAGRPTLLSHGDRYCTDDRAYQRWRRFSRSRLMQWIFLHLPRSRRERIAGNLRSQSDIAKRNQPQNIMDVNERALRLEMAQVGVTRLIHGHTHRPGTYPVDLPIAPAQRLVLPDWRPAQGTQAAICDYLEASEAGIRRCTAP